MSAIVGHNDRLAASNTAVVNHSNTAVASDTVSRSDSYVYNALPDQHFRLIRVVRRNADQISCEIKTCSRLQNPSYAAVSYAWGEPPDTHYVSIEGRRKAIRENLWHFLHDATTQDEWLWIDAVCINQDDLEERSQQVQMMTSTFRLAERTYIWLGPSTEDSEAAMRLISRTAMPNKQLEVHTLQGLTQRAYWTRLWVFQELMLSGRKILCCGDKTAPFEAFRYLLVDDTGHEESYPDLDRSTAARDDPAQSMLVLTRLNLQHNLLGLIMRTKHLDCAEVHDRAFALLGVRPRGSGNVSTDYSVPVPHLLNSILLSSHREVYEPRNLSDVIEQCKSLSLIFGRENFIFQLHLDERFPPAYELPTGDALTRKTSRESIAWALYYGHTSVLKLITKDNEDEAHAWLWHAATQELVSTTEALLRSGVRLINDSKSGSVPTLMETISMLKDHTILGLFEGYGLMSMQQLGMAEMITAGARGATKGGNMNVLRFWLDKLARLAPFDQHQARINVLSAARQFGDSAAIEVMLYFEILHNRVLWLYGPGLMMAAQTGDVPLAEILYSRAASRVHPRQVDTWSVFNKAIKAGHKAFVEWALVKNLPVIKVSSADRSCRLDPESPLLLAAQYSKHDIVDMLLAHGVDVEVIRDPFVIYSARSGNMKVLKLLITGRSNVDRQASCGQSLVDPQEDGPNENLHCSALAMACQHDQQEVIHFLLQKRADTNKLCYTLWSHAWRSCTPLYLAVATGNLKVTEFLLQAGASPAITECNGYDDSRESACIESVQDVSARPECSIYEQHAIWIAARDGHSELVKLLYQHWPALPSAVHYRPPDRVWRSRLVLHTMGILFIAAACGWIDTVKLLLQLGARDDPDTASFCEYDVAGSNGKKIKWSALYVAAVTGNYDMVELLLDAGVPVTEAEVVRFDEQWSVRVHALRAACKDGNTKMVELLKSYGAVDTSANVHIFKDSDVNIGFWKPPLYIERHYVPNWSRTLASSEEDGSSSEE